MQTKPAHRPQLIALLAALLLAGPIVVGQPTPAAAQAAAFPTARVEKLSMSVDGDELILKDEATSQRFRLHPVAAAVFALSNGKTSPAEIGKKIKELTGYSASEETVFAALDALADARLLTARVTPPGTTPVDLVVLIDGTIGSDLVAATSKEMPVKKLKEALAQEQAQKKTRVGGRHEEEAQKGKMEPILKSTEARLIATKKHKEAEAKKEPMKGASAQQRKSEESAKITSRNEAKEQASKESTLRKSEAAAKTNTAVTQQQK